MVYASDFRNGKTFIYNGDPCVVLEFQHVKPGKGAAFVRTKYPETYEQDPIAYELVKDAVKFIKENDEVTVKYFQGKPFSVEAPTFVDLIVTEAEPAAKGNTATNVTKIVTVETGATVQVPSFIEEGEKIQIDTRTGEYLGRAK